MAQPIFYNPPGRAALALITGGPVEFARRIGTPAVTRSARGIAADDLFLSASILSC
jgi:hypothetical protein